MGRVARTGRSGAMEASGEHCVGDVGMEVVGVEVFPQPLTALGVLWMSRIGEDVEQLTVAPGTAAILGRTLALSGSADGTGRSLNGGQALLDHHHPPPRSRQVQRRVPGIDLQQPPAPLHAPVVSDRTLLALAQHLIELQRCWHRAESKRGE